MERSLCDCSDGPFVFIYTAGWVSEHYGGFGAGSQSQDTITGSRDMSVQGFSTVQVELRNRACHKE